MKNNQQKKELQLQHVEANDRNHAERIVMAYAFNNRGATTEEGYDCMVVWNGMSTEPKDLVAVITWEA